MNTIERLVARRTIEALRSGVPGRQAVSQLGTTQHRIREAFEAGLSRLSSGEAPAPLVLSAGFGSGKTHLLECLKDLAETRGFVTSYVVVSPEMPLGNPKVVLKAIAESAVAPGKVGSALNALADDLGNRIPLSDVVAWATEHGLDGRFQALVHIYDQFRADEELRHQILDDVQGAPLIKTVIKQKLGEIGASSQFNLSKTKNDLLAHDRIRLLSQLYKAAGATGWVVLFDELERMARFSLKQRTAAYEQLGWWKQATADGILPVFTMTAGFLQDTVTGGCNDAKRLDIASTAKDPMRRNIYEGVELLKSAMTLTPTTTEQEHDVAERIHNIYEQAYGMRISQPRIDQLDAQFPLRTRIRKWITQWDLQRYDPNYKPNMATESVEFDNTTVDDAIVDDIDE